VYRALDTTTGQIVALKAFHDDASRDDADVTPVLRETRALLKLHHRNILPIYNHGMSNGVPYLVLEFADADSLARILARRRSLPPDVAVGIVREVALALEHAHRRGIIHGDIKPSNVLISRDGRVLVSDFGLALAPGESPRTAAGVVLGTPSYMAPEQARGEAIDPRTDLFSLGAVLYEALAGVRAFSGESAVDAIRQIVEQDPASLRKLNPYIPAPLERTVFKALAKDPADRFQSAREFVRALDTTGLASHVVDQLKDLVQVPARPTHERMETSDDVVGMLNPADRLPSDHLPGQDRDRVSSDIPADDETTASALPYVRKFETIWNDLLAAAQHQDKAGFVRLAEDIVQGALRETIGYRIEHPIPYFRGIVGYMVDAPMLWIRHRRFPVLFVAFDPHQDSPLSDIVKQLEIARATEFFALLVVVPTSAGGGNEAEVLRRHVSNSVFQHDFVVLDGRHLGDIIAEGSTQRLVEVMLRQGVGLYSLSPYVVNGPVPERMFFGREQEVKVISQNLVDRDYAVLGGRRIGKSSILQRLDRLLNADPRYFALYINCEDKMDRREFLEALAGNLGVELDSAESRSFRDVVVPFIKANSAKRLVFLLDEIDELLAREAEVPDGARLFKTFRGLSHEGTCRFVFSGSRTLHSHLHDSRSPFFNFCDSLILRPLDEKSVTEIVTKPMRQLGIDIAEEEQFIQRLVTLTSSHPNLAQWVCDRLVKRAFERLGAGEPAVLDQLTEALRSNRRTSLNDLDELSRTRDFHEYYVSTAWGDAAALERLISLLMPGPAFTATAVREALKPYGVIDAGTISKSLDILELYSLIESEGQHYRFRLTEFPRLVREFDGIRWQLDSVVSALERETHGHHRRSS
jgi:hypothetical protein